MKKVPLLAFATGLAAGFAAAAFLHSKQKEQMKSHIKSFMRQTDQKIQQMKSCIAQHTSSPEQQE